MKFLGIFRRLGLGALAAIVGAVLLLSAPKAEARTFVAIGVGPGFYAPYYPPYPYGYYAPYPGYPAYYAPAPVYGPPLIPFVGSVGFFFGPHGYSHGYSHGYGSGHYHH
ncbi:MAG: hypothetical protein ACM3O6_17455 [Acidobacteriota bacterium]